MGITTLGAAAPFALRLCCWVNLVGIRRLDLYREVLAQSARWTYSAHGATSLPHTFAVSESSEQRCEVSLQFPLAFSKKSARHKGSQAIHFSTQASTSGRTGSRTSRARESRLGVSVCRPSPNPDETQGRHSKSGFRFKQSKTKIENGVHRRHRQTRAAGQG